MDIYLVDDNNEFRGNLKMFIQEHLGHKVVGETDDGKSFIENNEIDADIILMDINMPNMNGLEATKIGMWNNHEYKIIAVSQHTDTVDLKQLITVGFKGFVSKVNLFRDLDNALKAVGQGNLFFPDEIQFIS